MVDKKQKRVDEAIIDHLKANDPDDKVRANYWRNQYEELSKQTQYANKERKRIDWASMLLCYTIYICCSANAVVGLVTYDGSEWDTAQRLLWCAVLAMNVGFAVFVAMSRLVQKIEKRRIDDGWRFTKETLEMKGKLSVAEHNAETAQNEVEWLKSVNATLEEENERLKAENQKKKK